MVAGGSGYLVLVGQLHGRFCSEYLAKPRLPTAEADGIQLLPGRYLGKLAPGDQLEVLLSENLAELSAIEKIEIALPPC